MKLLSIEYIPGAEIEALGMVKGTIVQTKNVGKDFMAGIENQPDVVFLHGAEQCIPIRIKPTVIIVCMGIKQHICFLSYLFRIRTAVPYAITSAALAMSCEEP